jgi:hypothetical protein
MTPFKAQAAEHKKSLHEIILETDILSLPENNISS